MLKILSQKITLPPTTKNAKPPSLATCHLKSVTCCLVYRYLVNRNLLVWSGALGYKEARAVFCGAKTGLPKELLIEEVVKSVLGHLKEQVDIKLSIYPPVSGDIFDLIATSRPDIWFTRCSIPPRIRPWLKAG